MPLMLLKLERCKVLDIEVRDKEFITLTTLPYSFSKPLRIAEALALSSVINRKTARDVPENQVNLETISGGV